MPSAEPTDIVVIAADGISAGIDPLGAELHYLRDRSGRDLLWNGDPAFWTGRAPLLFPIVGGLVDDRYRLDGKQYALPKHGFARRCRFDPIAQDSASATFRLQADDATRAAYPFDFRLDMRFAVTGSAITLVATVSNLGDRPMPASFGFHPALRWPLPYGQPRADHRIHFDQPEPAPIRRLDASGLLDPAPHPTPIAGQDLALDDSLFAADAIILDRPASRRLHYGASAGPRLRVDFPDMPMLGIWMKPGADYLCIEPWQGIADPAGFIGDFSEKPGMVILDAGEQREFAMTITIED